MFFHDVVCRTQFYPLGKVIPCLPELLSFRCSVLLSAVKTYEEATLSHLQIKCSRSEIAALFEAFWLFIVVLKYHGNDGTEICSNYLRETDLHWTLNHLDYFTKFPAMRLMSASDCPLTDSSCKNQWLVKRLVTKLRTCTLFYLLLCLIAL